MRRCSWRQTWSYLPDARIGAALYDLGHTTVVPLALIAAALWAGSAPTLSVGLIWVGHIGFDRLSGTGLKYAAGFRDNHLGEV